MRVERKNTFPNLREGDKHFNLPGHDLADFLPFEKVRGGDPFVVETRVSYWIQKYGVLAESRVNRRS